MPALYIVLAQLLATLITKKIQDDSTTAAERQKLQQSVDDLWDKVNEAHIKIQTSGVKNDAPKT